MKLLSNKKLSYIYEIPLFYLLLSFLNLFFTPENPSFIDINPHPYWLGILLFGLRYGVIAGTCAGFFSGALYLAGNWFFGERFLFEDTSFYIFPSFFIIIGSVIGLGVDRYIRKNDSIEAQLNHIKINNKQLKQEVITQNVIISELEKKIVGKMSTLMTLYQGAQKFESIELNEIFQAIIDFFSKTLDVKEAALYVKKSEKWQLFQSYGWDSPDKWSKTYDLQDGLIGLAARENKIVSIKDILGADFLNSASLHNATDTEKTYKDCLIAGPLKNGDKNEVLAVFAIQHMSLININSATINLFSFLLSWANRSISRALYFEDLKSNEILDPQYNIYSYTYFLTRLKQEFVKSKTYYLPLTIAFVKINGLENLSGTKKSLVFTAITQLLKESCRDIDVIAKAENSYGHFSILLSTLSETQSVEVIKNIKSNFSHLKLESSLNLEIKTASFTPQIKSMHDLIETAGRDIKHAS